MILGNKRQKSNNDDVILISHTEIRVIRVSKIDEESISAESLTLPRADAEVRYYPSGGRAFVYGWTGTYLAESERISELEQNVALKNMFSFGTKTMNIPFFVMAAILVITIIVK